MEPFIGQIQLLPYNFAPNGWAFCEGQLLPIAQYTALFSLIGTYFGGNGTTNFALPNLKGKEPDPNMHYCIALQGIFPSRS
jgi:microcystin-dependent protein